jgi:peptidyl-prolyl cis-trans isomerase C
VNTKNLFKITLILFIGLFLFSSCSIGNGQGGSELPGETPLPTETTTPSIAIVNGEGILLSEYESELLRYKAAMDELGQPYDSEIAKQDVINDLIAQTLFAQSAATQGYNHAEEDVQQKIDQYAEASGGQDALQAWMNDNFYDQDSFREAVSRDMAVIWMRNMLLDQVPEIAEQIHARQILVDNENEAIGILRQLEAGTEFKTLAFQYDPDTGGDLGWFPRGYLLQPDVENTAFSLQPGEYSGIIPTNYGFHLVEVIESDPQRPLSQNALIFIQKNSLEAWLDVQLAQATIEIMTP